jgi:uncharacterized membrane protein YkvI
MFGVLYGIAVAFLFRTLRLKLNLRFHNWAAVVASLIITTVTSEVGYHRGHLVSHLLTVGATIACAVVAAFISARPCKVPTAISKI